MVASPYYKNLTSNLYFPGGTDLISTLLESFPVTNSILLIVLVWAPPTILYVNLNLESLNEINDTKISAVVEKSVPVNDSLLFANVNVLTFGFKVPSSY